MDRNTATLLLIVALAFFGVAAARAQTDSSSKANADSQDLPEGFVKEAPLPEGFPLPSEPGKVVEKNYPVIRSYSATGADSFVKCFGYLSLKQHKMTVPVVMECPAEIDTSEPSPSVGVPVSFERMHFLLEKNSLDEPKEVGPVKVADMPSMRVLSMAFQGESTPELVKKGQAAIEARLKEMPEVERDGDYRILGYNSPMLERSKNFWELQLPIAEKDSVK